MISGENWTCDPPNDRLRVMITVEAQDAENQLAGLLTAVEQRGESVLICRDGKPVAELRAPANATAVSTVSVDRLRMHPELKGVILYDPTEPASEDEWPSEFR